MTKVAVVFHSGYGHTVKQAEAVAQGANDELIAIDAEGNITEAQWVTLNEVDAIVFCLWFPNLYGNSEPAI